MEILQSEYTKSSERLSQCPTDSRLEFAFIGRSNVGKSSLINMLCNHRGLAKTSSTPGKTLMINHFIINRDWYLVDLPGYGFAKRSKTMKQKIERMISSYILQRRELASVFVLIDIRHEPQAVDIEFIDWLGRSCIPFSLVFTKADKLSAAKAQANVRLYMEKLEESWEVLPPYFITSSNDKRGRQEMLDYIGEVIDEIKKMDGK